MDLRTPIEFDEDFDLLDADGYPLLFGADIIDHNPDLGREIARRVNYHNRLVELTENLTYLLEGSEWKISQAKSRIETCEEARQLLKEIKGE